MRLSYVTWTAWFKSHMHRDEITQDRPAKWLKYIVRVTIGRNRANLMNNWIKAEHLSFRSAACADR